MQAAIRTEALSQRYGDRLALAALTAVAAPRAFRQRDLEGV